MLVDQSQGIDKTRLAAISALFSAGVLRRLMQPSPNEGLCRLVQQSGLSSALGPDAPLADFLEAAHRVLERPAYRNEYTYKSAITQKLLLGRHSLKTATLLSEFRVRNSVADLVILNGTSTVYEIKSERDSLDRLSGQLRDYQEVFANTYVVTGPSRRNQVLELLPCGVGLLILTERGTLSRARAAICGAASINPRTIFDSIRTQEAMEVLRMCGRPVPDLPNTRIRSALAEAFTDIEPIELHRAVVSVMRKTRSSESLREVLSRLPRSLHAFALSVRMRRQDKTRLLQAMKLPLKEYLKRRL
ncbi:sce7726 family protein [bacterium]|nr:sce7726 family protein [bacterium]